jgi:hypothetical protein
MKKLFILEFITIFCVLSFFSCTKEVVIDLESGEQMVGIYGSVTNEMKKQSVTLSRSMGFYDSGQPEMISGAIVTVSDGNTVFEYEENSENPGLYESKEPFAGEIGHTYRLSVSIPNSDGSLSHLSATSTMKDIPEKIDSAQIVPVKFNGKIIDDYYKVSPFFQTLADNETVYLTKIAINDMLITDTLSEYSTTNMMNLSGMYFNGSEMEFLFGPDNFPSGMYTLNATKPDENIQPLDKITIFIYSIDDDYRRYIQEIRSSAGSNPFMGTPSNVRTNIYPAGKAVGYFYAASMIRFSFMYLPD